MKITDMLEHFYDESVPLEPAADVSKARVLAETQRKLGLTRKRRRVPVGFVAAAAVVAVLSVTASAAYENGWFGFDRIFGEKTEVVEEHIVTYAPSVEDEAQPSPLPAGDLLEIHPGALEDSNHQDPVISEICTADTTDYRFTLESMLAGRDTLYAIVKMEPLTDYGRRHMGLSPEDTFYMVANNVSGFEESASLGCELLSDEEDASYYLLTTVGSKNDVGDVIQFELLSILGEDGEEHSAYLFNTQLQNVVEDTETIELDTSVYDTSVQYNDTMTVTPLSLTVEGWFNFEAWRDSFVKISDDPDNVDGIDNENGGLIEAEGGIWTSTTDEPHHPEITITLTDGTIFRLCNGKDVSLNSYGEYGTLMMDVTGDIDGSSRMKFVWSFSQITPLEDIAVINVDGVDYTLY